MAATRAKGYNPRQANGTLRSKVRARVLREENYCWLCGQSVDVNLRHGLPESPEVDEVIPVSKGGSPFDRANCRLAHRICNQKRGNKTPTSTKVIEMKPLKTSRKW